MIQRIQSIFLVLIAVAMGVALANPIWSKAGNAPGELARLTALQYRYQIGKTQYINNDWYLAALMVVVAIVALVALFSYRNRLLQMALCAVNALLMTITVGIILYTALSVGKNYGLADDKGHFEVGFIALIVALVCNALANRFIRRDERLVRESNRIR